MPFRSLAFALLISIGFIGGGFIGGACSGIGHANDGSVLATQCAWSASLNDAGPGDCRAERALLNCSDPSGVRCICLSNDPTSCSACGSGFTCQDRCAANEYGVVCGSVGGSSIAVPPAGCTNVGDTPGGTNYCCPCS